MKRSCFYGPIMACHVYTVACKSSTRLTYSIRLLLGAIGWCFAEIAGAENVRLHWHAVQVVPSTSQQRTRVDCCFQPEHLAVAVNLRYFHLPTSLSLHPLRDPLRLPTHHHIIRRSTISDGRDAVKFTFHLPLAPDAPTSPRHKWTASFGATAATPCEEFAHCFARAKPLALCRYLPRRLFPPPALQQQQRRCALLHYVQLRPPISLLSTGTCPPGPSQLPSSKLLVHKR